MPGSQDREILSARAGRPPGERVEPPLDIDCVVPAAGLAARMGGDKLTALFLGKPLVEHAVANALAACRRVIVVVGHDAEAVRSAVRGERLTVVDNPDYRRGMITSIARGAAEVQTPRFFVAPADMPFLSPPLFRTVAAAAGHPGEQETAAWLPRLHGRPAHPVLVATRVREDLAALLGRPTAGTPGTAQPRPDAEGFLPSMRAFLSSYRTVAVPVEDEGAVMDIDTAEDAARYESRHRSPPPGSAW